MNIRVSLAVITMAIIASLSSCSRDEDVRQAQELARRVVGAQHARHFIFERLDSADCQGDTFRLEQRGDKLVIAGNNANSMAVGLNHYLKYYCHAVYGWMKGNELSLPPELPALPQAVEASARVRDRFFLNYCTFGYTMPWWQWEDWEHFIDWMALNGVNLPLAITGQESIWYQIWTEMGLSDQEVRAYFTGPAHLPWHRMQNIDRWGGPLPKSWLEGQQALQQKIVARERELNMKPVLPAFSGHVPRDLSRLYPDAPITQLEPWSGYSEEYACSFLDPMSELYAQIQKAFIQKEMAIYGTDHIYGIDIFNELMPPSWEPDYLGRVSRQVFESLEAADPDATWLQMGWLFYNERQYWTNDRVEAYLTSFPRDRQIILDYFCERQEVWQRTDSFFGVPYIWCYLGNFGGNTALVGRVRDIDAKIENALANGGRITGIGATLEGLDCNPYVYEFLLEKAWTCGADVDAWIASLASERGGSEEAWKTLIDSVYVDASAPGQASFVAQRPAIGRAHTTYANARRGYDNRTLCRALGLLLDDGCPFDLVNFTRQMLSNRFDEVKPCYEAAVAAGDTLAMQAHSAHMLEILDDIERITACHPYFLVGKWIADARSWGRTEEEKDFLERNARNLITTWSDADMDLNDYASRTWNGLVSSFYRPRWEMFFASDKADYDSFSANVTAFEKRWWDQRLGTFPAEPQGDARALARELWEKYRKEILGGE